jgi:large subunit ribosomal protein L15
MPLQRRLPKRGFTNTAKKRYAVINVKDLDGFDSNAEIDSEVLKEAGLVRQLKDGVALLGVGEVSRPLTVRVHKASRTAKEKIEAAGGKVEII